MCVYLMFKFKLFWRRTTGRDLRDWWGLRHASGGLWTCVEVPDPPPCTSFAQAPANLKTKSAQCTHCAVSSERHGWAHGPPALLPDLHLAGLLTGGWAPWHRCRLYGNGNGTNRLAGTQGEIFRVVKQSILEQK